MSNDLGSIWEVFYDGQAQITNTFIPDLIEFILSGIKINCRNFIFNKYSVKKIILWNLNDLQNFLKYINIDKSSNKHLNKISFDYRCVLVAQMDRAQVS